MVKKFKNNDPSVFIADGAQLIGDITLGHGASIWYNAVLRADLCPIRVGENTNIQDLCVLHGDPQCSVVLGDRVSIGHMSILHGCEVGDDSVIGMGSTILNGAKIGKNCLIGAGSLITKNTVIPDNTMAFGRPAKIVRTMTEKDIAYNEKNWKEYAMLAEEAGRDS